MLQPLNDNVFVEVYPSNDKRPAYADATIVELPENLEYMLRVGDRVKVNLENAILLERRGNWTRRFIINYTDIIAVYKEKKENKEEKMTKLFEEKHQEDSSLLTSILYNVELIDSILNDVYTKLQQIPISSADHILKDVLFDRVIYIKDQIADNLTDLNHIKEFGVDSINNILNELEKDYTFESNLVKTFLLFDRNLILAIQNMAKCIRKIFGENTTLYLGVSLDPDCREWSNLDVTIKSYCTPKEPVEEEVYNEFLSYVRNPRLKIHIEYSQDF